MGQHPGGSAGAFGPGFGVVEVGDWKVGGASRVFPMRNLYLDSPSDPNQKWVHDPMILGNDPPFPKGHGVMETPGGT